MYENKQAMPECRNEFPSFFSEFSGLCVGVSGCVQDFSLPEVVRLEKGRLVALNDIVCSRCFPCSDTPDSNERVDLLSFESGVFEQGNI